MRYLKHILLPAALVLLAFLSSCERRGRVIPEDKFARIYVDMFLADQWLSDHSGSRRKADTTDFYGPVFSSHGYSFRDYNRSMEYYLDKPERYVKIAEKAGEYLDKKIEELKGEEARIEELRKLQKYLRDNALPPVDFKLDTILWRPDTLSAGAAAPAAPDDSLAAAGADSVLKAESPAAVPSDSALTVIQKAPDVKRRDGIRSDTLKTPRKFVRNKRASLARETL